MKLTRPSTQSDLSLLPLGRGLRGKLSRLLGEDGALSIDGLDAGIRTIAFATVLVMSVLGYGRSGGSYLGVTIDPVLVAVGLVLYNLLIITVLGVPWRKRPGFGLFLLDWLVVSTAILIAGGFFSPFLLLYYALIIGAALRVGLSRSLLLVGGCAAVYIVLSTNRPTPVDAIHLPVLAVGVTSLLMVAVTAVAMKRSVEVEVRKVEFEEQTAGQLRLLNNLTRVVLSGSPDLEGVMRTVAAVSSRALQADSGFAVLFDAGKVHDNRDDDDSESYHYLIVADQDPNPLQLSSGEVRVMDRAVHTQAPVSLSDVQPRQAGQTGIEEADESGFPGLERHGQQVRTVACVPFLLSGGVIGVLFVGRYAHQPFGEAEVNLLTAIGQQMAVAVRLARLYEMERERASRSEHREQLERDLLSMVSHELRTPLTSIKTCVGTLVGIGDWGLGIGEEVSFPVSNPRSPTPDPQPPIPNPQTSTEAKLLHNIERSTDRLIVMVNELLDMSRLRAGRVSLNLQQLNMGEVIQDMVSQVKPLVDDRWQTLTLDLPVIGSSRWTMLTVSADRRRIEQVLLNLLSNANKYSPEGGQIALGATPKDGQVRIFVRDDGPGISSTDQEHIFEKFYRASLPPGATDSRPEGSGLGLAIARSIVELHGGQIGVHSKPGRGSTFYFTLTCEAVDDGK